MKYFFILLTFTLLNFAQAETCHVELYSKIYRVETNQTLNTRDVIYKTDCAPEVLAKITQIISSANGVVAASFLEKEFANQSVQLAPRKISLFDLNTTLHEQLAANSNLYFLNTQSLNQLHALSLMEGESLKAICESCSNFGEKNIKIDIANPIANTSRSVWFSSKIFAKVKVLKAKRNLSFQDKSLTFDDFYSDETLIAMPQNILTKLENIQFYKPNKSITEGSIITNMDLQAINLVTYGTPVKVILKNQNINLVKNAMPARSAQLGEAIEVQTNNSNRKILGRVIDFNTVVIEL
jgi:flagella basal body P-ring formation protein FlgA